MKIARVLCPSDLSDASAHAAECAVAVAGYYKAGVTALHMVRPILRVAPELPEVAADERTDVFVIGVHGRNPVGMSLFGSTTNQVVRRATCPVLTFRQ